MIQLNEPETLCTATINPAYRPNTIKFDDMKNYSRTFLNDREFQKFTSGKDQKGVTMFGLYFFKFFNKTKTHDEYVIPDEPIPETLFFSFFEFMKNDLSVPEQKQLFIALSSPRNYRHFSTFNISSYESLWTNHGHLLSHTETLDVLGDSIFWFIRNFYNSKFAEYETILHFLIDKIGKTMTNSEIFEVFVDKNDLHKATLHKFTFENLWPFFANHTTLEQQKEILRHYDSSGKFMFYDRRYIRLFDYSKLNILHFSLIYSQKDRRLLSYVLEIYTALFSDTEMQEMILKSNDFLLYALKYCGRYTSKDYFNYLEKLFDGKEELLKELLDRKIERTDLNAIEYMKSLNDGIPEVIDAYNEMYDRVATHVSDG